jgi:flagellar export protein FliJ
MKAKKYRLETVLDIRAHAKDAAARQIALCYERLTLAEEELNRRQIRLQTCFEQQNRAQSSMQNEMEVGIQAQSIQAHQIYLKDLRKIEAELKAEVEKQIKVVEKAEREIEAAREKLIEAAKELKAIEIHKTNWQAAERNEGNRRDRKISDEIGSILHGRRRNS